MQIQFPLILDGATGTELQKRGFQGNMSAEQWVMEHPQVITEIQKGYVRAGSGVLYAPTFGGNRRKLEEHGIFNKTAECNRRLAELSKKAAEGKAFVAGDMRYGTRYCCLWSASLSFWYLCQNFSNTSKWGLPM